MADLPGLDFTQVQQLVRNFGQVRGAHGFSEEELRVLIDHANECYTGWLAYETVLQEMAYVDVCHGEVGMIHPDRLDAHQRQQGYLGSARAT